MPNSRASILSLLLLVLSLESASAAAPFLRWQRSALFPGLDEASAVAFDPGTGRLAVGDAQGVWLSAGEPATRRVLRRGPVHDLAFSPDAGLYAATDRGLYHLDAAGEVTERSLGPGARVVRRVLVTPDLFLAATEDGAFLSRDGWSWARLDAGLSAGEVGALAVRRMPGATDLWLIVDGTVERATLKDEAGGLTVEKVVRVPLAAGGRRDALDLSTSIPGAEVAVLGRWGLSLYRDGSWVRLRPAFPPGAEPRRLGRSADRLWIATDRGLLEAASPLGPWRRAAPPVGNIAIAATAGGDALVHAAGARGLFTGRPRSDPREPTATHPAPETSWGEEPTVQQVQVAAIRYLDLGPQRIRALQRGLRRRGWLPRFELRGSYAGGRSQQRDYDQAFTYDAPRLFLDREIERSRDFAVSASLIWELGDLAYHPESIDVSKEAREIIELRDEVLDEITQLYFERRRALLELAGKTAAPGGEAARLRLRADEFGSGLDAWTGGWWSRATSPAASPSPLRTPQETHP